jgi:hypothetical protein
MLKTTARSARACVFLLSLVSVCLAGEATDVPARTVALVPGRFYLERPTLNCLGFQWYTSGDDNKDATAEVTFRKVGEKDWRKGFTPWRLNGQQCVGYVKDIYTPEHMFAGSIFDLQPDTEYEFKVTLSDPDGVRGEREETVKVKTRGVPQAPVNGRILHLGGRKPDFTSFREAVSALKAGDTLLVHKGTYALSRPGEKDYLENHAFTLDLQGTRERPITIKAAGDGPVIFDGRGSYMLFDVQNSSHLILDGLTIKRADFAVYVGCTQPGDNAGIEVRDCSFEKIAKPIQGFAEGVVRNKDEAEPKRAAGRIRHVVGPSKTVDGKKVNPDDGGLVFKTLGDALIGGKYPLKGCARNSKKSSDPVRPGDTIVVHRGEYLLTHKHKRHWGPCYFYNSAFVLNIKGTAEKPVTIRGVGKPVFDGAGNYKIFDLQGSEHLVIEGLAFRNASFAIYKGSQKVERAVEGLTVRNCRFEDVGCGVYGISGSNRDFLITDNVFIGRGKEEYALGKTGRAWGADEASYSAIHLAGQGHVISYNSIDRFFDGLQLQSNWSTTPVVNTYWTAGGEEPVELKTSSVDIHNNLIQFGVDNAIEADMGHHNLRIMRNLCLNSYGGTWSNQVVLGGPCYWIRNIAYAGGRTVYKIDAGPIGVLRFHNTHFGGTPKSWPPKAASVGASSLKADRLGLSCGEINLNPSQSAGILSNPPVIDTSKQAHLNFTIEDFYPTEKSPAIDKVQSILPNINDDFTGKAPDAGAIEVGKPMPHYGPRKEE